MSNPGRAIELQKELTIDGEDYKIHMLPPSRAFKLAVRLTKFIGEPVAAMAASAGDGEKVAAVLPAAIKSLMNNLDEDGTLSLIQQLLESVTQKNKQLNFEHHFAGRLGHMLKLTTKVVEVQFSDFFESIGDMVSGVMKKVA